MRDAERDQFFSYYVFINFFVFHYFYKIRQIMNGRSIGLHITRLKPMQCSQRRTFRSSFFFPFLYIKPKGENDNRVCVFTAEMNDI